MGKETKTGIKAEHVWKYLKYLLFFVLLYWEWYAFAEYYLRDDPFLSGNFIGVFLLAGIGYVLYHASSIRDKRAWICGGLTGTLMGAALLFGRKMYTGDLAEIFSSLRSVVKYGVLLSGSILFWIQAFTLFYVRLLALKLNRCRYPLWRGRSKKAFWAGAWLAMALCYMPCYFSNFPGIMSYDSGWITRQALGILPFDNFHPFLHTLIWTAFIKAEQIIGIPQFGLVSYSIVQALAVTAVFTCVVYYMAERGVRKGIVILTWMFYAFCPTVVLFSLITTKDVLFGTALVGFTLSLLRISEIYLSGGGKSGDMKSVMPVFCITGVLSCLLRNNMVYAMAVSAVLVVPVYKPLRKSLAVGFGIILLVYLFVEGPVYHGILKIQPGDAREALSVPMNQMARVYTLRGEELPEEERREIEAYMPTVGAYDELFADPVKDSFDTDTFLADKGKFVKTWGSLFVRYPLEYAEAFLTLNVPYWCPETESERTYIELGNYSSYYTFEYREWLPHVGEFYHRVASNIDGEHGSGIMRWPLFHQFFSLSAPFWLMFIMAVSLMARGKGKCAVPFLPVMLLWMTYLLGPVSNFRYIYPMVILYPLFACYAAGGIPGKETD